MIKNPQQSLRRSWLLLGVGVFIYAVASLILMEQGQAPTLVIGSKNFTESLLVGELYAQTLERAGYKVQRKFNLGGTMIAHEALKRGQIDLYPEYTGTAFLDILHQPAPKNFEQAYHQLNEAYQQRWHLSWLTPSAVDNSQALVLRRDTADRLGVRNLSELSRAAPWLVLASIPEFEERPDGLQGLISFYGGFKFKRVDLYDNGLKYQALKNKSADAAVASTTDGALSSPRLLLMVDDRAFWPKYRLAPVLRQATLKRMPFLEELLDGASARLNNDILRRLNADVDLRHQDPRLVIRRFLSQPVESSVKVSSGRIPSQHLSGPSPVAKKPSEISIATEE
jgi:osmoprotectant transport system substrate-binding protein